MKVREVLVKVYEPGRLQAAWQQVRKNAGAAGIDQMTVEEFVQREEHLLALIHDKLKSGSYRFQPARRVLIPKQGTSETRKLGIPVVMDRIVGTSMHRVLEEIFDPDFTESNLGFRRGRSQHQAIRQLQKLVKEGREWAVAVDLKSFFDEISHGLILQLIRRKLADEQFATLLARLLKAGVIDEERTTEQGQVGRGRPGPNTRWKRKRSTTSWSGHAMRAKFVRRSVVTDFSPWWTTPPWSRLRFCAPTRISPIWKNASIPRNRYSEWRRYFWKPHGASRL
jgi:RNA-directed DNA polymerase